MLAIIIIGVSLGILFKGSTPHLFIEKPPTVITEAQKIPEKPPTDMEVIAQIAIEFGEHNKHIIKQAIDIAYGESGITWNRKSKPNTNGTIDWGIFQINDIHTRRFGDKFKTDWKENIRVARILYEEQGWNPWVAARKIGLVL